MLLEVAFIAADFSIFTLSVPPRRHKNTKAPVRLRLPGLLCFYHASNGGPERVRTYDLYIRSVAL